MKLQQACATNCSRCLALFLSIFLGLCIVRTVTAGEVVQSFPARDPADAKTAWRIVWAVTRHLSGSEILYIKEAHFKRSFAEPEIQVLGDCRLAEIFVPYNEGTRIYDISQHGFSLSPLHSDDLGPACVATGKILDREGNPAKEGFVAQEVHDGHLRWRNASSITGLDRDRSRRGEELLLWSVLSGANYRYIILYSFADDGHVSFRLGATAHNLFSARGASELDRYTHLHTGCWRLNIDVGNAEDAEVKLAKYVAAPGGATARTEVEMG